MKKREDYQTKTVRINPFLLFNYEFAIKALKLKSKTFKLRSAAE